jgi:hypothetical protein
MTSKKSWQVEYLNNLSSLCCSAPVAVSWKFEMDLFFLRCIRCCEKLTFVTGEELFRAGY